MADVTMILKADNSQYISKVKEAQQATQKLHDTAEQGMKREKGLIEDMEDSLKQLQEARRKAFTVEDIEKYNKKIQEAKQDLEEYEKAGMGVERQTESMTASIGKWVLGLGIAMTALRKLKDAFLETKTGMDAFNIAGAAMNQVLYNIVAGMQNLNYGMAQVIATQRELNALRYKEKLALYESSKQMILFKKYSIEAHDQTKTATERIKAYDKAIEANNKSIDIRITNTKNELKAVSDLLDVRQDDEKLTMRFIDLATKLNELEYERNSRLTEMTSMRSGLIKKELADQEKAFQDYLKWIETVWLPEQERLQLETMKKSNNLGFANIMLFGEDDLEIVKQTKKFRDKWEETSNELAKSSAKWSKDMRRDIDKNNEEIERKRLDLKRQTWETIIDNETAIFDLLNTRIEHNFNKEMENLSRTTNAKIKAAGDDEKKILAIQEMADKQALEIEKRYRKEQQKIAVAQTIISGAQAIVKTFAEYGFTPAAWLANALLAASTALQIGIIKAQKFAKGGWTGKGGMMDETGEKIAGIVHEEEFVTRKGPALKYREVLEAINKDDRSLVINRFNKIAAEQLNVMPVNNISIENKGPNERLDRINNQLHNLNRVLQPKKQIREEVIKNGNQTLIRKGNNIRIVK